MCQHGGRVMKGCALRSYPGNALDRQVENRLSPFIARGHAGGMFSWVWLRATVGPLRALPPVLLIAGGARG
jgi:hypothetical protein